MATRGRSEAAPAPSKPSHAAVRGGPRRMALVVISTGRVDALEAPRGAGCDLPVGPGGLAVPALSDAGRVALERRWRRPFKTFRNYSAEQKAVVRRREADKMTG